MNNNEVSKIIYVTLTEVAKREKLKAMNSNDYIAALFASFFEGLFKEAQLSLKQNNIG